MEERYALYYPYIHFRDINWLKSVILTFGQVRRMVPHDFALEDEPIVDELRHLRGRAGVPVITEERLDDVAVQDGHRRLRERLEADSDMTRSFSKRATDDMGLEEFEIFPAKITNSLMVFLASRGLAWPAKCGGHFMGVHPRLGEAIMSITAIAIAREKGLSIVTPNSSVHHALSTHDEQEVYEAFLQRKVTVPLAKIETNDLLQAVLIHTFDLSSLSAVDIASLLRENDGLRSLRAAIEREAQSIPPIADPVERAKRASIAIGQVEEEWHSSKRNSAFEAIRAVFDLSTVDLPATVNGALAGLTLASVSLGVGLAVAFVTFAGIRAWRGYKNAANSPYRYLTLIGERAKFNVLAADGANAQEG